MLRVYECLTQDHDLRLVALAAVICVLASYTAFNLAARAYPLDRRSRYGWLAIAAVVTGSGVWATHFVAMLAFRPGYPVGYDLGLTVLSILIAIVLSGVGYYVGLRHGWRLLAGAIVGSAVGAMHYTGMAALDVSADRAYDTAFVVGSVVIGVVVAAAACRIGLGAGATPVRRLCGAGLLVLAICGLHFTAMAAVSFTYDPTMPAIKSILAPDLLAIAVTAVTVLIVALGFAGAIVDQHLAGRAAAEAERLRNYIGELEETKRALAARTEEVTAALEKAEAGSQAKSQFLATMSHELRTPLNAVIGFAEIQLDQTFGPLGHPRYLDYAEDIRNSGKHLLGLINDILDFSKLDAGHLELHEEAVSMRALIVEVAHLMEPQADKAGVSIRIDMAAGLPEIRGEARRLRQVLLNLLSNAIKFTPRGGEVTVGATAGPDGLAVSVRDTGIGMAPEDIDTALEAFGQVDSRLSREYEGTGLGLPLARLLVELHDGRLEIDSVVGNGTTVTVTLPASRVASASMAA